MQTSYSGVEVELDWASPPWFGFCNLCNDHELGWPKPEMVGRFGEGPRQHLGYLCLEHLAQIAKDDIIATLETEVAQRRG